MRFQVIIASVGAITNIALSVYLTQRIGIPGVVYGSILNQVIVVAIPCYWYLRGYFKRSELNLQP